MTNEEMKSWFLNKFEESFEQDNFENEFIDDETQFLEDTMNSSFKFGDEDKKYLKKEYTDNEIKQTEAQTQKLLEQMAWNGWKKTHFQETKTTFNFSEINWELLDEYEMIDLNKSLELNKREAEAFSNIWHMRNTHYHIGKQPDGSQRIIMIDKMTHYLCLRALRGCAEIVEKFPQYESFNKSLLEEVHKIIDDEEFTKKYDLDYIGKQNGISKRVKNATKKIKDNETGIIYESAKDCAEAIGKSSSFISKHKDRFQTIK